MRKKVSYSVRDIIISAGQICFLLFAFRLWPLILLVLFVGLCVTVKKSFFSSKNQANIQLETSTKAPKAKQQIESVYDLIKNSISFYVNDLYPNAQWIWESVNAWKQIQAGEDVYIRLNKTGEYRRIKVLIKDMQVIGVEVLNCKSEEEQVTGTNERTQKDDSESVAFEWVDSHITQLNEKCNEVIGQGDKELVLSISDLPLTEMNISYPKAVILSWETTGRILGILDILTHIILIRNVLKL